MSEQQISQMKQNMLLMEEKYNALRKSTQQNYEFSIKKMQRDCQLEKEEVIGFLEEECASMVNKIAQQVQVSSGKHTVGKASEIITPAPTYNHPNKMNDNRQIISPTSFSSSSSYGKEVDDIIKSLEMTIVSPLLTRLSTESSNFNFEGRSKKDEREYHDALVKYNDEYDNSDYDDENDSFESVEQFVLNVLNECEERHHKNRN